MKVNDQMQRVIMIPKAIKGPPPKSAFHNLSEFDRIGLLLSLSESHGITRVMDRKTQYHAQAAHNKEARKKPTSTANNVISLFDGALEVDKALPTWDTLHKPTKIMATVDKGFFNPHKPQNASDLLTIHDKGNTVEEIKNVDGPSSIFTANSTSTAYAINKDQGIITQSKVTSSDNRKKNTESFENSTRNLSNQSFPTKSQTSKISPEDLDGLTGFCRNVCGTQKAVDIFKEMIVKTKDVGISIIWKDLTINHETSSVKYCTGDKACRHWYCDCDKHIRASRSVSPLLGISIMFPHEQSYLYFIPLSICLSDLNYVADSSVSGNSSVIPFKCSLSLEERWELVAELFSDQNITKILYHAQVAFLSLITPISTCRTSIGKPLYGFSNVFDPRVASYVLNSDIGAAGLELQVLCNNYALNNTVVGNEYTRASFGNFGKVTAAIFRQFSDLKMLIKLKSILSEKLEVDRCLFAFSEIEMPLVVLLSQMELRGVGINIDKVKTIKKSIIKQLSDVSDKSRSLASSSSFNLGSPDQVAHFIYDILKIPPPSSAKKGTKHFSTSEEDLLQIKDVHPIIELILSHRTLNKLLSTYIDGYIPFVCDSSSGNFESIDNGKIDSSANKFGGAQSSLLSHNFSVNVPPASHASNIPMINFPKIHACFNQTVVRTGRLSCCKPNLQNIPNNTTIDGFEYNIRSIFHASSRRSVLISADYSQIEMRILAHVSQDKNLTAIFQQNKDVYKQLASALIQKPVDDINDSERNKAKTICLGVIYGMGVPAMARNLGIDVSTAGRLSNRFFERFKSVKDWNSRTKQEAKSNGFIKTICGRRCFIPEVASESSESAARAQRQAVNAVIQGSSADILKCVMIVIEEEINKQTLAGGWENFRPPALLLQVHDELIYEIEVPENIFQQNSISDVFNLNLFQKFIDLLRRCMQERICELLNINVPLSINISLGFDWGHLESIDKLQKGRQHQQHFQQQHQNSGLPDYYSSNTSNKLSSEFFQDPESFSSDSRALDSPIDIFGGYPNETRHGDISGYNYSGGGSDDGGNDYSDSDRTKGIRDADSINITMDNGNGHALFFGDMSDSGSSYMPSASSTMRGGSFVDLSSNPNKRQRSLD